MTNFDWLSDLRPIFAAQDAWLDGSYNKPVTAHLPSPAKGPFSIACGAGLLADHIRHFKFTPNVIQRLGQVTDAKGRSVFQESFLNHLQRLRLRAQVNAAPEGTLLLPGEPVLSIQAPELQIRLLESALRLLVWESSYWATESALRQWRDGNYSEEETPHAPHFPFHRTGWKMRAQYIGGEPIAAGASDPSSPDTALPESFGPNPLFLKIEQTPGQALAQIRRLFRAEHPLADVWLTEEQDAQASVSHTHIQFSDIKTGKSCEIQMSRFQNLMQPVLVKGHPALNSPSLDYLRQRTWKQLEAFKSVNLETYLSGWGE